MRVALVLLALALHPAVAAAGPFEIVEFGGKGRITQKAFDDLDGDGRAEIILMDGHRIRVYSADEKGRYDRTQRFPLSFELSRDALYFDVGQVDEVEKTLELVIVTPAGVMSHAIRNGRLRKEPRLLIPAKNLVTRGQRDDVHWRGFLRDIDGDGLADVVLPTRAGFALFFQRRHGEDGKDGRRTGAPGLWPTTPDRILPVALRSTLTVGPLSLQGSIHGTVGVPNFRIEDFSGNGKNDFAVDDGRLLRIFPADAEGRIAEKPDREVDLLPFADAAGDVPPVLIRDLNGDRRPDFLITRGGAGTLELFLGNRPFTKPAFRVRIDGWAFGPRLTDLDGDGRLDLIFPSTPKVGPVSAIRVVATGAITVQNHIYLNTGDRDEPFRNRPDLIRKLRVRISPSVDATGQIRTSYTLLVEYGGDFVGDGRKDLVYRVKSDRLGFFPGRKEGLFASDPAFTVKIPDTKGCSWLESAPRDLNGDGRTDLVLFYRSRDRTEDRVVLLLRAD